MKKLLFFVCISAVLFSSCDSAQKALQRGSYAQACMMAVKKLQKKPNDVEHAEILTIAYQKANQANMDRIEFLKVSDEMTAWDEIYKQYKALDRRQKMVETVLPLRAGGKTVNFEHVNYSKKIVEAKRTAADYHYNKGLDLLDGDKYDARLAYSHFSKVGSYTDSYSDLNKLIKQAQEKGITTVLLSSINKTYAQLPPELLSDLVNVGMDDLDYRWVRYFNTPVRERFDYNVFVTINSVYVSPNEKNSEKDIVKKEVRDGWEYEYDSKGNVKKDTLGNDIKKPKYKTISCTITRKIQLKKAKLQALIEYQDNKTSRIVGSYPVEGSYFFEYISSYAHGDLNALEEKTRKTVGRDPISYPADIEMLNYAADELKKQVIYTLKRNKKQIK